MPLNIEVWLSLVERHVRDVEAVGSNPVTSTKSKGTRRVPLLLIVCDVHAKSRQSAIYEEKAQEVRLRQKFQRAQKLGRFETYGSIISP